jgi:hypothetical protein
MSSFFIGVLHKPHLRGSRKNRFEEHWFPFVTPFRVASLDDALDKDQAAVQLGPQAFH